jgi:hypothetical protein
MTCSDYGLLTLASLCLFELGICRRPERVGEVNTPSYLGGPGFKSQPRRPAILIAVFRSFLQYLYANARLVHFTIHHHSLIILLSTLYSLFAEKSVVKLPTEHIAAKINGILKKLMLDHLVKKFLHFTEIECSFLCSQKLATGSYCE